MSWTRETKYSQANEGRTHRVAAVRVLRAEDASFERHTKGREKGTYLTPNMGGKLVWQFEAWRLPSSRFKGTEPEWLGLFDNADAARAHCERDAAREEA